MAKSKQRGRPKTGKGNRVRVSIMLDPDLVDWSRNKRSDMVNRLLRLYMGGVVFDNNIVMAKYNPKEAIGLVDAQKAYAALQKTGVKYPDPNNMAAIGDNGGPELVDDRITLKEANHILEQLAKGQPKPPKDQP